jgi:starvation-inducible DNA-binding protein
MNIKALTNLLADNFVVYTKAHGYHFNVVGPDFYQYHKLFGKVYEYLYEQHDMLGELIRQHGFKVPTGMKDLCELTVLNCDVKDLEAMAMNKQLVGDLKALAITANSLYNSCKDPATETLIGEYAAGINKLRWFLESTIK